MTRVTSNAWPPLVIPACCFIAGVLVTLLWTSSGNRNSVPAPAFAAAPRASTTADAEAFGAIDEAANLSTNKSTRTFPANSAILSRHDLLLAIPSSLDRLPLVQASRSWREDTRAFVVVELNAAAESAPHSFKAGMAAAKETFGSYADLEEGPPAYHKPGDARAAMAPFLANQSLGPDSYKWMLYGDDDTVFYLDNVLRMLEPLDHTMPYYITDHIWFLRSLTEELDDNRMHPARSAPRCLPCNYHDPLQDSATNNEFGAPQGCPCTKDFLCAHDNLGVFGGAETCNVKQHNWWFGHGGAGAILSSGLMKLADFDTVRRFVDTAMQGDPSKTVMSGDGVFMQALHSVLGIMPTDPGYGYYRPHIQMFDPAWREDDTVGSRGKHPMAVMKRFDLALHDWCSEECEDLLQHLMTIHLGSRDAADDAHFEDILPAMQSAADNSHLSAAAYMHQKFAGLFKQYSEARKLSRGGTEWFSVFLPKA